MVVARLGLEGAAANCPADAAGNVEAGDLGDYAGHHGIIAPLRNNMAAAAAFPTLVNALGIDRLNGLMNLSYLVGMECPGLDGIFSAFSIVFSKLEPPLTYRVIVFDDRFSRVTMAVEGAGLSGTVSAIAGRPEPPALPDQEIFDLVERSAFAGQQPLVIGGSSGLGAITVLLLAAGGARPTLTYRGSGKAARDLAARIEALGGACDLLQFDAADPARGLEMLSSGQWRGQEIYYFATPRIFRRRIEPFQHDDFREFFEIYVNGLYELMRGLMRHRSQDPLTLFYPSSVAVETRPTDLFEYALAKDAGERLCRLLERRYKRLSVIVERLPRIVTRQTQTFVQASGLAAHEVMIPIIRRMQQKR
jgi:NADP-dependent 3-hydroxy acid dehydrogenase YdfG